MRKLIMPLVSSLVLACSGFANASIITNGDFETGDLTGWTTNGFGSSGSCPSASGDWVVGTSGSATGCSDPGSPADGAYAAYNMFDAALPFTYSLTQSITIPDSITSAILSWTEALTWSFSGDDRFFSIDLFDTAGTTLLENLYSEAVSAGSGSIPWTDMSLDITSELLAYQDQTIVIGFSSVIPEGWTGPAGIGIDNIALNISTTDIPEPPTAILLALGALLCFRRFQHKS